MLVEQRLEHILAVEQHLADPGQMVEADLVDEQPGRSDAELGRDRALEVDRDVAEPDRAVAVVQQRARHDPHRVGEIDDPGVVGGALARTLGDLEHDGHGSHCLRQPAGAGRLLSDAAAGGRDRLVPEARRLPADPDLDEDGVGPVERAVEIAGHVECAVEPLAREDPLRQRAEHLAPVTIDVMQRQAADVDPLALAHQPGDELGRVGRSGADDREFHPFSRVTHPFTPVSVIPSTNAFWAKKNRMITGAMNTTVPAITRFQLTS